MYRFITGSLSLRRLALVVVEHVLIATAVILTTIVHNGTPVGSEAYGDWITARSWSPPSCKSACTTATCTTCGP